MFRFVLLESEFDIDDAFDSFDANFDTDECVGIAIEAELTVYKPILLIQSIRYASSWDRALGQWRDFIDIVDSRVPVSDKYTTDEYRQYLPIDHPIAKQFLLKLQMLEL